MHALLALAALAVLQCCDICASIRVPVEWNSDNSEVSEQEQFSVDEFKPQDTPRSPSAQRKPIPVEYFQYTAKKPQFAVDIAAYHGVRSPENHYKAYPVRPYTGKSKPEIGKHRIQEETRPVFNQFQQYINQNEEPQVHATPVSANYEVFHPYKAEEPGLQELYKDPILDKIRNDIRNSSQRLQSYENEAGKPEIASGEYLESPEQTDRKKLPQRNIPAPYEIHRPQRRPIYYAPVPHNPYRELVLNQRFKHPWNQNFVKVRPLHYRPLKHHLQRLRQHHALTFDDEQNEYPQVPVIQAYEEPPDGYDIYEKGKAKYVQLRNNLDESVNDLVRQNRPIVPQKLELQKNENSYDDEEQEFVPIKNYAQVRKTETTKHLPKEAAFNEAENYEEIRNAPRLREAIKSTKAQTVYTEEGYEDSAYDHAGEQKHASDHEAHGGYLRENELSGGKYKAPSFSAKYEDGSGSAYRDKLQHGKQWKDDKKNTEKEHHTEDFSENEHEQSVEANVYGHGPAKTSANQRDKKTEDLESENFTDEESQEVLTTQRNKRDDVSESEDDLEEIESEDNVSSQRNKREESSTSDTSDDFENSSSNMTSQHDVNKRETTFKVPEIDLNSTFLNEHEILEIAKQKIVAKSDLKEKYPYYFKNLKSVHKDSPLRYSENLKLIPKKSKGGTEFYDSRSQLECPEVDDKVDAIPEKLKKDGHPDEVDEETDETESKKKGDFTEAQPRLTGLGDKIDCFKAKYFGENPLDSPFFKEEIIINPEPVTVPNLSVFKLKNSFKEPKPETSLNILVNQSEKLKEKNQEDIFTPLEKIKGDQTLLDQYKAKGSQNLISMLSPGVSSQENTGKISQQSNVYTDILHNIKNNLQPRISHQNTSNVSANLQSNPLDLKNLTYDAFKNKEDFIKSTPQKRRKRGVPFVYEPYKIIRDVQITDSKKTTTTGNVSPLIKQLQSSKVIDTVVKSTGEKEQPTKRGRIYKDITRKDRDKSQNNDDADSAEERFVDVNVDQRRGEPRYELRPSNHKSEYTPVENRKAISVQDYEAKAKQIPKIETNNDQNRSRTLFQQKRYYTKPEEVQNSAASNTIKETIETSPATNLQKEHNPPHEEEESEEDYEEYDDEEDDAVTSSTTSTTTSTTPKPSFRRKIRTTTERSVQADTEETPKLQLVTRFRNAPYKEMIKQTQSQSEIPKPNYENVDDRTLPKYREKKKKSSKSTLVTDTKKYGDGEDDMRKEEIDALIGVKHDMDEYMPMYEKEMQEKMKRKDSDSSEESEENDEEDSEDDYEDDEDEEDEEDDEELEKGDDDENEDLIATTTEATKRTLVRTTNSPPSTTQSRSAKLELKPIITKKKIEIHKELPVNKTSPHVTQFKQDIEEVEIIKEIPRKKAPERKPNKNLEVLDLYKDENLAKTINNLGAVELFKDLDLEKGPKHGGNYKIAPELESSTARTARRNNARAPKDAEASQTENKKLIELSDDDVSLQKMHGGNLQSINDMKRSKNNGRSAKLIELSDTTDKPGMHGGNLKSIQDRNRRRGSSRSEKLIELSDDHDDDDDDDSDAPNPMHGGNFKSYGGFKNNGKGFHGGNYRSAKLVQVDNEKDESEVVLKKDKSETAKEARSKSAVLLNSFAQAAPILTTPPAFIVDPSKRMYYYVD